MGLLSTDKALASYRPAKVSVLKSGRKGASVARVELGLDLGEPKLQGPVYLYGPSSIQWYHIEIVGHNRAKLNWYAQ